MGRMAIARAADATGGRRAPRPPGAGRRSPGLPDPLGAWESTPEPRGLRPAGLRHRSLTHKQRTAPRTVTPTLGPSGVAWESPPWGGTPCRVAPRTRARHAGLRPGPGPGPPLPPGACSPHASGRDARARHPGSVGADRPEAVGAVDRSVHPRSERDLRLVPARRTDHRKVLAIRPIDAPLVAARPADVADVARRATFACGTPARPAARAALRVRGEPLLGVILLIGGGMDEVDPTVDAVEGPISVGHDAPPGRDGRRGTTRGGRPDRRSGKRGLARQAGPRRPRCRCGVPVCGAHRFVVRGRIQRSSETDIEGPRRRLDWQP